MTISDDYFAGLFDGEGCVSISLDKKGSMNLSVKISMCSRAPVFAVYERFGGRLSDGSRKTELGSKIYTWSIENASAVECLEVLSSRCINKKEPCIAALKISKSMAANDRKQPLPLEDKLFRLEQFRIIANANVRGGSKRVISQERIEKFLAPKDFGRVRVRLSDGRSFNSMTEAAKELGVSCGAIWHGVRGGYPVKGFKVYQE